MSQPHCLLISRSLGHLGRAFTTDAFQFYDEEGCHGGEGAAEVAAEVLHALFSTLTTTSPNALLLASLDATRAQFSGHREGDVDKDGLSPHSPGRTMLAGAVRAADSVRALLRSHYLSAKGEGSAAPIALLDDALEKSSHLLVDPLRLTLHFDPTWRSPAEMQNSIDMDDYLCESNKQDFALKLT